MYAYMYVCTVYVLNSQSPNCCSLTLNTRSVLLLLSVLPSNVSVSERRKLLAAQLPKLLSQVPDVPSQAGLCRAQRHRAAAAAPAHAQCCWLVSTAVTRGWLQTQGWQVTGSASSVQGKGKKGGIQCIQIHTRGKKNVF